MFFFMEAVQYKVIRNVDWCIIYTQCSSSICFTLCTIQSGVVILDRRLESELSLEEINVTNMEVNSGYLPDFKA